MKASIRELLKEFDNEPKDVQKFLKELFQFEHDMLNMRSVQYKSKILDKLDAIIGGE